MMKTLVRLAASVLTAATLAATIGAAPAFAQDVKVKDLAHVQGVTDNQLVGYGLVTGLAGTGDSTSVLFTSHTIQNVLQSFGLTAQSTEVRTRNVAAVMLQRRFRRSRIPATTWTS